MDYKAEPPRILLLIILAVLVTPHSVVGIIGHWQDSWQCQGYQRCYCVGRDSNGASSANGLTIRQTSSSSFGAFEIPALPVGAYELSVSAPGFKRYTQTVSVDVNQESRVEAQLRPGEPSETVTVVYEARQVQSTTSTLGKVVGSKLITDLPLNGRNFYDLGLLQTGVVPLQPGRTLTQNAYNVNGARDTSNNFLLDGVSNQELEYNALQIKPTIDALAEFKIQTNLYSRVRA